MRITANFEEELDLDDCKKTDNDMTALIVHNCDQQKKETLINVQEIPLPEETDPASHFELKQHESTEEVPHVSGRVSQSQANSGVVEEKVGSMYASKKLDSQVEARSEKETDGGEGKEMFDITALAALLNAVTGSDSEYGSALTGVGPLVQYVMPAATPATLSASSEVNLSEEEKSRLQKLLQLKVKFLRLVGRLGYTVESASIAEDVMNKLAVLTGRPKDPAFSFNDAKQKAAELEAEENDDLNFSLNILVLGKSGVGKSATINSIFGEEKVRVNAFKPETTSVQDICGVVGGVKIRVIDTPGLRTSVMEQGFNRKVLAKVKKSLKKYPPDVVLYVDRLDSQTRYLNDVAMFRTITSVLGSSVWHRTILTLTHAGSAPPDGSIGMPLSYDIYVSRASQLIQKSVVEAVDDYRLMNLMKEMAISLVENQPVCRKNLKGEKVLPHNETGRNQILLLCYSRKVLSEASSTSKPQNPFGQRKLFGLLHAPPLAHWVSSLLKSRPHPELPNLAGIPESELDYFTESDLEEEDDYDQLPPFRPLRKSEVAKLKKDQKKAYFDEYDLRVKLLQKKQWKMQCRLLRELKKQKNRVLEDYGEMPEMFDAENEPSSAAAPETLPDILLPLSFDPNSPSYRYRVLRDPNPLFEAKSLLDIRWDHDFGFHGVCIQRDMAIAGRFPAEIEVQVNKDRDVFKLYVDAAVAAKHGECISSLLGVEVRPMDEQHAYTLRGETKVKMSKHTKTTGGLSVFVLGEDVAPGLRLEHQVNLGKRRVVTGKAATVRHQQNAAYAANLEVRLRGLDFPVEPIEHVFAVNFLKYGEMAVEAIIQSQFKIGRSSKMAVNGGVNTQGRGHIAVTTRSSNSMEALLGTLVLIITAGFCKYKAWYDGRASEK